MMPPHPQATFFYLLFLKMKSPAKRINITCHTANKTHGKTKYTGNIMVHISHG